MIDHFGIPSFWMTWTATDQRATCWNVYLRRHNCEVAFDDRVIDESASVSCARKGTIEKTALHAWCMV